MIVQFTNQASGKECYINPDHITEVESVTDKDGNEFSRLYLSCGHRTFIDVAESAIIVWDKIKNIELYAWKHIFGSEMRILQQELERIRTELRRK